MSTKTNIRLIVAASLFLAGCIIFGVVMTVLKWDFPKLSTSKFETNVYTINESFKNLSLITETSNVSFVMSENEKTSVVCLEPPKLKHSVKVEDSTLVIELRDSRKWYEHIGINFTPTEITVHLPKNKYGAFSVKTSTGKIDIGNISAENLSLSVSTGKITASNMVCSGDVDVRVSTGDASLSSIRCKNLTSDGSTGDITLTEVIAEEKFEISRTTGDVRLEASDASEISVNASTGDVSGKLLTEKTFIAHSGTGKVVVPNTDGGRCEISVSTGDIRFE